MEGCPHYILPPFPECFSCLLLKMALTEVMLWCCQAWLFAPFAEIRTMTLALSSSRDWWWSWGRRREAQSHVSLSSFLLNVSEDSTASRTVSQSSCCPWVMRVKEKKKLWRCLKPRPSCWLFESDAQVRCGKEIAHLVQSLCSPCTSLEWTTCYLPSHYFTFGLINLFRV